MNKARTKWFSVLIFELFFPPLVPICLWQNLGIISLLTLFVKDYYYPLSGWLNTPKQKKVHYKKRFHTASLIIKKFASVQCMLLFSIWESFQKFAFFFSFHQFGFLFLHWFSTGNLDSRKKRILFQKNCWKLYYSLLLLYYPLALHAAHVFFFGFSIGVFVTLLWELLHLFLHTSTNLKNQCEQN